MSFLNEYFDKIYVINLFDKLTRWDKMRKQFKNRKIEIDRFIAVDGRCKDQGNAGCLAKLHTFETLYDVKISNNSFLNHSELVPASSLTIGTIQILRHMVKNKLDRILICEDDIELIRGFEKKFTEGIMELNETKVADKWDIMYLGCGEKCGNTGVSYTKSKHNKNISTRDSDVFVNHKNDIRMPCEDGCDKITEHISYADFPLGSWCYAFSLKGAKKMLKIIDDDAGDHVDRTFSKLHKKGGVVTIAFDPPIVMHEEGYVRPDSDIPWTDT
jgi:GR25 family glycosyltransferase involved in LPS biosynthesis